MLHLNFRNQDYSHDDVLPAEASEEDEDASHSNDEGVQYTEDYEVPEAFYALVKPEALLTGDQVNGLFILFLRKLDNHKDWGFGKVECHKPRARIYNYDLIFEGPNEGERSQGLKLENYYMGEDNPEYGAWVFLRATVLPVTLP